jgi:hypothetical protein
VSGRALVEGFCSLCGKPSWILVDADRWRDYREGLEQGKPAATHGVQALFPDLSAGEREILLSGIHPACWDTAFGETPADEHRGEELP